MTIRPIHLLGSPILRERAAEVGEVDDAVRALVQDLFETMHADRGIGLAANQIGVARRVAVVQIEGDAEGLVLIDPVIVAREGSQIGEEGCLSIPEIFADVERAARVIVETTTLDNRRMRITAEELRARAVQHEIDHLDGVLFIDHLSPLKRQLLLRKWRKLRKGQTGFLKEVAAKSPSATL